MRKLVRQIVGAAILGLIALSLPAQDWKPVPGHLMTRWAVRVDPSAPLPEYPRPQMVRSEWINLNGLWDYRVQPLEGGAPDYYERKILVPFPIESALSGVRKPLAKTERLWYHRGFQAPKPEGGGRLLLHFGAVDWETKVTVNGRPVGEHRGGYDPFTLDITDAVKSDGTNELVVAVFDPTNGYQPKGKQNFNKFTKPGGIAYTACSGIWQTVWLETVPTGHIEALRMTPDLDSGSLRLKVVAAGSGASAAVQASAWAGEKLVGEISGRAGEDLVLPVKQARAWTPNDPFLYALKVRLGEDAVTGYFGMRNIAIGRDEKGFARPLLNGKFIFQAGPLDQGYWPDGIYTAPTDEALRFDIEEMKKLGFNMVRKHLKVEPERWYYWCDKLGLLVWQDMPNGDGGTAVSKDHDGVVNTPVGAQQFEAELRAMIETHYNHPAIVLWTIFNEGWGQYDVPRLTQLVRELDGTRWVNSTSGWHDQKSGDLKDVHSYPGPDCAPPEPNRATVLGEFGGLGLAIPDHAWVASASWGYRTATGPKELTRKYVDLWRGVYRLKDESGLCAAVYTQLTDVETEGNGLLTYDREVEKPDVNQVADANRGKFVPPPTFATAAPTAQEQPVLWRYSLEKPEDGWFTSGFDDSKWKEGAAGFGDASSSGGPVRTDWKTGDLWLRRKVLLPEMALRDLWLRLKHEQEVEVYLNGVLAARVPGRNSAYEEMDLKPEAEKTLRAGANLIAVHCGQAKQGRYFDAGLVREQLN